MIKTHLKFLLESEGHNWSYTLVDNVADGVGHLGTADGQTEMRFVFCQMTKVKETFVCLLSFLAKKL